MITALLLGFTHAFEADHLVAVSSIVTARSKLKAAIKDGLYWGLGHTSTILLVGVLILLLKVMIPPHYFHYLEALVGFMLLILGTGRIIKILKNKQHTHMHLHGHEHVHQPEKSPYVAYGIGLIHGLTGSGILVVSVMAISQNVWWGLAYLLIFGLGSVAGMMTATGLLGIPFAFKEKIAPKLAIVLPWLSAILCILLGLKIIYINLVFE